MQSVKIFAKMLKNFSIFLFILISLFIFNGNASALSSDEEDILLRDFIWQEFIHTPKNERPTIGVTLSAGALRGASHIGVMEVLEESGLPIDYMSGTSMGCIIGALYTSGVPMSHAQELLKNLQISRISADFTIGGILRYLFADKLFSSEEFQNFIDKEVGGVSYEDLRIPFACVSADIKTGEKVVFDSGPLSLGVRASMNLPGIFEPVEYRQRLLVDGGIVDYMPVDLVKKMGADWSLAVYALPDFSNSVPSSILGYVLRTGDLRGAALTENSEKIADFVILSRVGEIGSANIDAGPLAVEIGASTAYKSLGAMKESIILKWMEYVFK